MRERKEGRKKRRHFCNKMVTTKGRRIKGRKVGKQTEEQEYK